MHVPYIWIGLTIAISQVSAANNRAIVTTPPLELRQGGTNSFIGFSQTGNTFHEVACGDAVWSTSGSYGNCCDPSNTGCLLATSCSSGTLIYPGSVQYDCGATLPFCDNGLVGETYNPFASTNKPPSISLYWCRTDSATPWTVWRTVLNVVTMGLGSNPTLVVSGASGISATSGTGISFPTAGGTITGPSATSTAPNSSDSSSSSGGLSAGGLVGVIVSVTCSVLGLLFGVGFKIWQHRKEQKKAKKKSQAPKIPQVPDEKVTNEDA